MERLDSLQKRKQARSELAIVIGLIMPPAFVGIIAELQGKFGM